MNKYIVLFVLIFPYWVLAQDSGSILLKNGTVLTVTDGDLEGTDVLIENGKITQIGKDLSAPKDVEVIDVEGQYVMPGIIDAHSHIAVDAINEATQPVTAQVAISDVINPHQIAIYRALAGGVTTIHAMHGSANVIGGQCQTLKLRYGERKADALIMEGAPRTIKFALGENPMRVHGHGNNIIPATRMGVEQTFRDAFSKARQYQNKWKEYKDTENEMAPPEYDLKMETLVDILEGDILIHCHSYRADEILMLLDVLRDFGIEKITLQHVNEGFKIAPELAEFGAMASVFSDWWAYKFEVYYSTAYNAAILTKNGVVTSINSDSPELIRHLYHEAAKSQHYGGLTDEEALALITINPARQLGIEDRVGSIEEGKDGDLAVFENHPLSIYATPQMTIVDGIVRFNASEDPADMRMEIDPSEPTPAFYENQTEENNCMQDTEFSHFHQH